MDKVLLSDIFSKEIYPPPSLLYTCARANKKYWSITMHKHCKYTLLLVYDIGAVSDKNP